MAAVGVAVEPSALPLVSASAESDAYDGAGRESVNATPMPGLTPTLSPTPVPTPVSSPAAPGAPIPGMVLPGEVEAETKAEAPPDSGSTTAPAVSGSTTAPAVSGSTTALAVSGSTTAPAVSGSTTAPAVSGSTTAPAVSGSTTAPANSGSTTAPAVSGSTTAPAVSGSTTAPANSGSTTALAVSGSTTAPAVSGSTTAPANSGSTTALAVSGSTTAPAVSGSTTALAVSGSTTAPAESAGGFDRSCIFCKIGNRLEPVDLLHWDEQFACFKDIRPGAPHHYLVVPRRHIGNCKSLKKEHISIVQTMVAIGKNVLLQKGVADPADVRLGFHWPPFCTVAHLHLHVLAPVSQMGFLSRMIYRADSYWFITHEHLIEKLKALPEDCSGS